MTTTTTEQPTGDVARIAVWERLTPREREEAQGYDFFAPQPPVVAGPGWEEEEEEQQWRIRDEDEWEWELSDLEQRDIVAHVGCGYSIQDRPERLASVPYDNDQTFDEADAYIKAATGAGALWVSIADAARILAVSEAAVRKWKQRAAERNEPLTTRWGGRPGGTYFRLRDVIERALHLDGGLLDNAAWLVSHFGIGERQTPRASTLAGAFLLGRAVTTEKGDTR